MEYTDPKLAAGDELIQMSRFIIGFGDRLNDHL